MKIKLNFKPDKPTINKRIYPRDILLNAIDDLLKKGSILIAENWYSLKSLNKNNMCGYTSSYEIRNDDTIIFDVNIIRKNDIYEPLILINMMFVSTDCIIEFSHNIVTSVELTNLFFTSAATKDILADCPVKKFKYDIPTGDFK
jgi:hypothetical protein